MQIFIKEWMLGTVALVRTEVSEDKGDKNKQPRTNDKGWSSSLGVGRGANNPSP
jgi:hypothetical protein